MTTKKKIYCVDCRDSQGNLVKEYTNIECDLDLIKYIIDAFAFEYALVIARSNDGERLYGKRKGYQVRRIDPPQIDLPYLVIKNTKSLKEALAYLKSCDTGFYDVITERGVTHNYMRSGFNLWEIKGEITTLK